MKRIRAPKGTARPMGTRIILPRSIPIDQDPIVRLWELASADTPAEAARIWGQSGAALRELRVRIDREGWQPGGSIDRLRTAIEENPACRRILRDLAESLQAIAC